MRLEKGRNGKGTQGTLSPEPPGILRLRAYRKDDSRKDDSRKDDNTRVIVLPYKPPGSALRLRPRRALPSDQATPRYK